MTDRRETASYYLPDHLCELVAEIASLHTPETAIDPCCEDVGLIGHCEFVAERNALFRNPSAMKDAAIRFTDVGRELHDITRLPLDQFFDLVVSCVPFGAKERTEGRTRRLDLIAAERCLDLLAPDGLALIVIPSTFLFSPLYSSFREKILTEFSLDAVIELPRGSIFEKTMFGGALLVIRRDKPRDCGTLIAAYDVDNGTSIVESLRRGAGDIFASTDQLASRWDRHFHDPAHQVVEDQLAGFETKRLEDIGEIIGPNPSVFKQQGETGNYLVASPRHLSDNPFTPGNSERFVEDDGTDAFSRSIVRQGDVIVSLVRPKAYVYQPDDPPVVVGPHVAVIRAEDNEYISSYLNTADGKELFSAQAIRHARGTVAPRLTIRDLREIRVPIIPLSDLNSVSDKAIAVATDDELEAMQLELLRVKQRLEVTEVKLEEERGRGVPALKRFVEERFNQVLRKQQATHERLDEIIDVLSSMRDDIGLIKSSSRDEEEKLTRICVRLDNWKEVSQSQKQTIDEYTAVVQRWFEHWELLEDLTKTFLPSAEHLYDELERMNAEDYSPFIIQYCRAIESEILTKLFVAYHEDIQERIADLEEFVAADLDFGKTQKFARCVAGDKRKYTLGDMNWIMQLMKPNGRTLAASPLMQDFRTFVLSFFDERVVEKEYLDWVKEITDDFRNKAAHPYLIDKETADKCLSLVRLSLIHLLDSYRTSPDDG